MVQLKKITMLALFGLIAVSNATTDADGTEVINGMADDDLAIETTPVTATPAVSTAVADDSAAKAAAAAQAAADAKVAADAKAAVAAAQAAAQAKAAVEAQAAAEAKLAAEARAAAEAKLAAAQKAFEEAAAKKLADDAMAKALARQAAEKAAAELVAQEQAKKNFAKLAAQKAASDAVAKAMADKAAKEALHEAETKLAAEEAATKAFAEGKSLKAAEAAATQAMAVQAEKKKLQDAAEKQAAADQLVKQVAAQAAAKAGAVAAQAAAKAAAEKQAIVVAAEAEAKKNHDAEIAKKNAELKQAELNKAEAQVKQIEADAKAARERLANIKREARAANQRAGIKVSADEQSFWEVTAELEEDTLNHDIAEAKAQKKSFASIIAKYVERQILKQEKADKAAMHRSSAAHAAAAAPKGLWGKLSSANNDWAARINARINQKKSQWQKTSIAKTLETKRDSITTNYDVSFDKKSGSMKVQTEALGYNGKPMYSAVVTKDGKIQETLNFGGFPKAYDYGNMTEAEMEEQRDMAFKVVAFLVGFILMCFTLLFAYHRMVQNSTKQDEKQNFFDFLAGQQNQEDQFADVAAGTPEELMQADVAMYMH